MDSVLPGRRAHRKSRAGYLQCKRRKVKCEEGKPVCHKCTVHGVPCSFNSISRQNLDDQSDSSASMSIYFPERSRQTALAPRPNMGQPLPALNPNPSDLSIADLELLHHYMINTCYTLSRVPTIQAVWRDQAPRIGFPALFVLHAIFAVLALHLGHLEPSRRAACIAQARTHHDAAITAVIPNLEQLASENAVALFLFSSLACIFSCATVHGADEGRSNFLLLFEQDNLSHWVHLFRRAYAYIHTNGGFRTAVRRDTKTLEQGQMYVWELRQMVDNEHAHDEALRQVYRAVLDRLACALAVTLKPNVLETADVFAWMLESSDEYLNLLRRGSPTALIIFSFWCVASRQLDWSWWAKGLAGQLLGQVHAKLGRRGRVWLRWPMKQIGWFSGTN
ncbi:hypothetical protein BDW69DRAFT_203220 [Aspergillus filifer]